MALILFVAGEARIDEAAALEAAGRPHEPLVTSGVQSVGGLIGVVLIGAALGIVFAVLFAATRHLLPGRTDLSRAAFLAATGFLTVYLAPSMKYPATLPGSVDPLTAGYRTRLYVLAVAGSMLSAVWVWRVVRFAAARGLADHFRIPAAIVVWGACVTAGTALMPDVETGVVSDRLLMQFRLATGAGSLALWAVMGLAFGWLSGHSNRRAHALAPPLGSEARSRA